MQFVTILVYSTGPEIAVSATHFCHGLKDDVEDRPRGRQCYRHPFRKDNVSGYQRDMHVFALDEFMRDL
jgi:hypothetical protein